MSRLLKPSEVADRLGISTHTLLEWRRNGFGPPWGRMRSNAIMYAESDLDAWWESRKVQSIAEERARGDRLHGAAESGGFR